ncbi:MAG TPA: class I SAM-dependent methyltransferase [Sphingomonas sp.]|nr:class I SAM-dependent methyltransferase [Sphingomonas sp.]
MLDDYAAATAGTFVARSEAVSSEKLLGPFLDMFPPPPARILDIGAGTGRDAAWLSQRGYLVTAVEPVAELREVGMELHAIDRIDWREGTLPDLAISPAPALGFDVILLSAVWQHLDDRDRALSMPNIADMAAIGGLVLISLRQGPSPPSPTLHEASVQMTADLASANGLQMEREVRIESMQAADRAAGIYWTWLAFRRVAR